MLFGLAKWISYHIEYSNAVAINRAVFCLLGNGLDLKALFVLSLIKFTAHVHTYLEIGTQKVCLPARNVSSSLFAYL